MALTNMRFKDQIWSQFGRTRREERRRRREEEEEEEQASQVWMLDFGMETHLDYEFYEIWHGSLGLYDDYLAQT